jgi:hypothetical protein
MSWSLSEAVSACITDGLPDLKSFNALTRSATGLPASTGLGATPWPLSPCHPAHTADLSFPAAAFPAAWAAPAIPNDATIAIAVSLRAILTTRSRIMQHSFDRGKIGAGKG